METRKQELRTCKECRTVVIRAYRELRAQGIDEDSALRTALRVLSLRHPEHIGDDVAAAASAWLFGGEES